MSDQPRGQMVRIPTGHYDPRDNPRSPAHDPGYNDRAHVTGRDDNPPPAKGGR